MTQFPLFFRSLNHIKSYECIRFFLPDRLLEDIMLYKRGFRHSDGDSQLPGWIFNPQISLISLFLEVTSQLFLLLQKHIPETCVFYWQVLHSSTSNTHRELELGVEG